MRAEYIRDVPASCECQWRWVAERQRWVRQRANPFLRLAHPAGARR